MPGLFEACADRSVFCDHRPGPVEAVDQRGGDGLHQRIVEGRGETGRHRGSHKGFRQGRITKVRSAVLGLHEQARRREAENIQVVFNATTDEPAIARKRRRGRKGKAGDRPKQRRTRPVRAGIAAIDIGVDHRRNQKTDARAGGPGIAKFFGPGQIIEAFVDLPAADMPVSRFRPVAAS